MRRVASSVSVWVTRLRSGSPCAMAETPKPLTHTASKPWPSIRIALIASWAPTATTGPLASPCRRRARLASARDITGCASGDVFVIAYLLVKASLLERQDQFRHPVPDQALGIQRHRADVRCEN